MNKEKSTISVNGGIEIDLNDKDACIEALTPMVAKALGKAPKPSSVANNSDIAGYFKRVENILNKQETLAEDFKELMLEAKNAGIEVKALKIALKEKRKPLDKSLKEKINFYMNATGQGELFC